MSMLFFLKPNFAAVRAGEDWPTSKAPKAKKIRRRIMRTIRRKIPEFKAVWDHDLEKLITEKEQQVEALVKDIKRKRREEEEIILAGLI